MLSQITPVLQIVLLITTGCFWLVLILVYCYWWYRTLEFEKDEHKFPSPFPRLPIMGQAYFLTGDPQVCCKTGIKTITRDCSPAMVWIGPWPALVITRPEDMEVVLNSPASMDKGYIMQNLLAPWLDNGLLITKYPEWKFHRKLTSQTFNSAMLKSFHPVISTQYMIMTDCMEKEVGQGTFELWNYTSKAALDSVWGTILGSNLDSQQQKDTPFFDAVNGLLNSLYQRAFTGWQHSNFLFFNFASLRRKMTKEIQVIKSLRQNVINEKLKSLPLKDSVYDCMCENAFSEETEKQRKVLLDHLLDIHKANPEFTLQHIAGHIDTFIFGGFDTTSTSTCFTILALALYPHIQEKVYEEMVSIFQKSDRPIAEIDLKEMKYLEMVVKESLRLFPVIPLSTRKTTAPIKLENNKVIPANVYLLMAFLITNRDKKHWPDPEKFIPERFAPENSQNRHPYSHVSFSGGPRNCIGYRYAMMALKTAVASIIRKYKVTTELTEDDLYDFKFEITIKTKKGYPIKIERR